MKKEKTYQLDADLMSLAESDVNITTAVAKIIGNEAKKHSLINVPDIKFMPDNSISAESARDIAFWLTNNEKNTPQVEEFFSKDKHDCFNSISQKRSIESMYETIFDKVNMHDEFGEFPKPIITKWRFILKILALAFDEKGRNVNYIDSNACTVAMEIGKIMKESLEASKNVQKALDIQVASFFIAEKSIILITKVKLNKINLKVYQRNLSKKIEFIVPLSGNVEIIVQSNISDYAKNKREQLGQFTGIRGGSGNTHPYTNGDSVCLSGYSTQVYEAINQCDIISLIASLRMWAETYSLDATPFHPINNYYMGVPKSYGTIGRALGCNIERCVRSYKPLVKDCEKIECIVSKNCKHYLSLKGLPEPFTESELYELSSFFLLDETDEEALREMMETIKSITGHEFDFTGTPKVRLTRELGDEMLRKIRFGRYSDTPSILSEPDPAERTLAGSTTAAAVRWVSEPTDPSPF